MNQKSPLRILALGGLGEIGLNLMVIECSDEIIIIDCGVLFPDLHWLGLDIVLPDLTYLEKNREKIKAIVVTHGHEDHIGAIPHLLKRIGVPKIYCSRFASRLLEDKCEEHRVSNQFHPHQVKAGDKVEIGCFKVEFIHVTHSTLETFALAIDTPHGLIVHSGDFKFDEKPYNGPASDKKRLGQLKKKKPLILLSDSTNSERCGHSASESSITKNLRNLVKNAEGAVVVALFASNVHRIHQLVDIASEFDRKVFLSGRSMERYTQIAIEENFLPIKISALRPLEDIRQYERNKILVLSTGSQGEARSSLLRLAKNENRWLKILPQDTVILSSRNIPGNERAINFVVNQLYKLGADVHYEDMTNVHVSGHAYQNEQIELLKLVKPRFFIPIHGEYRHLVHHIRTAKRTKIPEECFLIENGTVWEFDGKSCNTTEVVTTGRHWIMGDTYGALDDLPLRERKAAARSGIVVVDFLLKNKPSELATSPVATLRGFLCSASRIEEMKYEIEAACEKAFSDWKEDNTDQMTIEQFVGGAARRVVKRHLDAKPLIIANFIKV